MSSLKELVKIAKGNDRTIKEYARDSGVDAAVISKIMAGKYIPKKTSVYESLTSTKACPRGGITYNQLVKAAKSSKSYEEGMIEGLKAMAKVLGAIGNTPISSLSKSPYVAGGQLASLLGELAIESFVDSKSKPSEKEDKALNEIQRFSATANGIVYGKLGQKGFVFSPSSNEEIGVTEKSIDTYLKIQNQDIEEYILRYFFLNDADRKEPFLVRNAARQMIEELIFLKPNSKRKISIVANCKEAYEELSKYKDTLSYKGTLSVILICLDKVTLEKEEYLAYYSDAQKDEAIKLV